MSDYGLLAIASAMERSAALIEDGARTSASENRGIMKARAGFLIYLAGVVRRDWVPKPAETEDDIL